MSSRKVSSPLRYPGGKACLSNFISDIADINNLKGGTYLELYAGGAGAALNLLFDNTFEKIHINDFDYAIFAMWFSILNHTAAFVKKINAVDVTVEEWHRQQKIYKLDKAADILDLGFAAFYLNRTNRSGIIFKAGPIGGIDQSGNYKIDVRFNKADLIKRIEKISDYRRQIQLTNLDALEIIKNINYYHKETDNLLTYLDPPYYKKGKLLYLNKYDHVDHQNLAEAVIQLNEIRWLISYDNVQEIKDMFQQYRMSNFDLNYTLQSKKFYKELLIFSDNLELARDIKVNSRAEQLILI